MKRETILYKGGADRLRGGGRRTDGIYLRAYVTSTCVLWGTMWRAVEGRRTDVWTGYIMGLLCLFSFYSSSVMGRIVGALLVGLIVLRRVPRNRARVRVPRLHRFLRFGSYALLGVTRGKVCRFRVVNHLLGALRVVVLLLILG